MNMLFKKNISILLSAINSKFKSTKELNTSNLYLFLVVAALGTNSIVHAAEEVTREDFYRTHALLRLKPEVGVDFGFTKTEFSKDNGDKMFSRRQIPMSIFMGVNFTDNLGMEVGYSGTKKKEREVRLDAGEFAPGGDAVTTLIPGQYHLYNTSTSIDQPYVAMKWQHRLYNESSFYFAAGFAYTTMHLSWENIYDSSVAAGAGGPPAADVKARRSQAIAISKLIPIIKAGVYVPITNAFSLRFIATWSQTNKLQRCIDKVNAMNGNAMLLKRKNNIQYSIGLVYTI